MDGISSIRPAPARHDSHPVSAIPAPAHDRPGAAPPPRAVDEAEAGSNDKDRTSTRSTARTPYSDAELARLRELRARDREVRAHERAHLSAAGPHARGPAAYSYEVGPDRRRYAVGGEVQIDTAPVAGDPAATLAKAQQIRRAALAPAEPSAQDRRVAAEAAAMAANARAELAQRHAEPASIYPEDAIESAALIEGVA